MYKHFVKAAAVPLTGAQNAPGSVLRTFGDFTAIYPFYRLENCGYSKTGPVKGRVSDLSSSRSARPEGSLNKGLNFVALLSGRMLWILLCGVDAQVDSVTCPKDQEMGVAT